MEKKLLLLVCGFLMHISLFAQSAIQVVKSYGENLHSWSETGSMLYRENIKQMCNGKKTAVFKDKLSRQLAKENNYGELEFYPLTSFLLWINKKVDEHVNISVSNIKQETEIIVTSSNSSSYNSKQQDDDLKYVSCDISITGAYEYHGSQLIYIRNGKITKIEDPVVISTSSGERKVKVDLSDIMDDYETWGFSYNYGKNWPIGLSANYSYRMFMIGADLGVNLDKDKIYKHNLEMTDVMNFHKEDIEYDPLFFFTVTPSVYLKYVSIGCGAGILYMHGKKNIANSSSISYNDSGQDASSYIVTSSYTTEEDCAKVKFMLRPSVKGFIPLTDELFLSLNVGYDYVFGYKEKNGINFGLGLQFELW